MNDQRLFKFLFSPFRILVALVAAGLVVATMLPATAPEVAMAAAVLAVLAVVFGLGYSLARLAVSLQDLQTQLDAARQYNAIVDQRLAVLEAGAGQTEKWMEAAIAPRLAAQEAALVGHMERIIGRQDDALDDLRDKIAAMMGEQQAALATNLERIIETQRNAVDEVRNEVAALAARAEIALDTSTVQRMDLADIRRDIYRLRLSHEDRIGLAQAEEDGEGGKQG